MVGSKLQEPVLSANLDVVGSVPGNEDAVGALWSVFTKVKDSMVDGRRLENMSWRLWHRARAVPNLQFPNSLSNGLPHYPEMFRRPLPSPSLSFSSSSEGTGTSSDWDHDTAVGEDDNPPPILALPPGAGRNTAVSPLSEKSHLDSATGTPSQARASQLPSPAPSSRRQLQSSQGAAHPRISPSAQSDSTPHPPQIVDARTDVCHERDQGTLYSESQHQRAKSAIPIPGLKSPSSPHDSPLPRTRGSPILSNRFSNATATTTSGPDNSIAATEIPTLALPSSSMPHTLPSMPAHRKPTLSVARIIAELFPDKVNMNSAEWSVFTRDVVAPVRQGASRSDVHAERSNPTPIIVEPSPTASPLEGRTTPWFYHGVNSPATYSATTSATSTPRQAFPTVVVVNPTPHPTPPATPSPSSENPFGLRPSADSLDQQIDKSSDPWNTGRLENDQLATPVSMNGDARSVSPAEPKFVMVEPKNQFKDMQTSHSSEGSNVTTQPQTSLLPAAAITLPEKPTEIPTSSHLPTPSSESYSHAFQAADMLPSSKLTSAPVPAPASSVDKKFFLAAPHSTGSGGSGPESSESPESLGVGSVSPEKICRGALGGVGMAAPQSRQEQLAHEDELTSSFSASSPPGHAPSITSSRGSRLKSRVGMSVAGGSRRRPVSKKVVLPAKQSPTKGVEESEVKSEEHSERVKTKGKEREVGERAEVPAQGRSTEQVANVVKPPPAQHRTQTQQQPSLRQLPTNPPRQQAKPTSDAPPRPHPAPPPTTKQLPFHPQLGHLGIGHLPTVPPRQRRPIEITETSSEYETTDSDGEESSWESESGSGDEAGSTKADAPAGPGEAAERSEKHTKTTAAAAASNRTRDAGEFARDAALEAQRQRELFQKLPSRSYSHLGRLPRAKSGLSLLFRPDPELFPEGHPYRTSRSSHDILARNWSAPAPPLAITAVSKRGAAAGPMQAAVNATPVVASVSSKSGIASGSSSQRPNGLQRGYRPRGKPVGQEEETDSGEEDPEDTIQISSSVAQKRLAALMGQRKGQPRRSPSSSTPHPDPQPQAPTPPPVSRTTTAPVLMHPYLPDPAPLQTPHTVRRNIISQELDEELRRNLLWERSQNQIQGRPARAPGSILPGPWRPLATLNPEDGRETQSNASDRGPGQRPFATQRTKSWAGDYHASGW